MLLRANCKINIGLDILRRREDSFHDLNTVMIPIRMLYDTVQVEINSSSPEITFLSLGTPIDCAADDNLCVRAARLVQSLYNTDGVAITLDKRVPFGAGLGGGSADATAVILAMNSLFDLKLSDEELIDVAAKIGSDTAFFVLNTPQLCSARGEVMQPVTLPIEGYTIVMVKPEGVSISTREAYAGVTPHYPATPLAERIKQPIESWQREIKNDFEPHIFLSHPILQRIKDDMLKCGATYCAMSGSGSTIFALFHPDQTSAIESLKGYNPMIYTIEL